MSLLSPSKTELTAPQLNVLSPNKSSLLENKTPGGTLLTVPTAPTPPSSPGSSTGSLLLSPSSVKSDLQSGLASPAAATLIVNTPPAQIPEATKSASLLANISGASTPPGGMSSNIPVRNTPLTFSDASGDLAQQDLEVELANLGFLPMDKIIVLEGNEWMVKYIKALVAGVFILIEMDLPGKIEVSEDAYQLVRAGLNEETIPYSVRVGALDCAGLDVCGMAFTCDNNGLCIVNREGTGNPSVGNFSLLSMAGSSGKYDQKVGLLKSSDSSHAMAHTMAVVKYSDIKANPKAVARSAKESGVRIINSMYSVSESKLESVRESMKKAVENVAKLSSAVSGLNVKFDAFLTAKIMAYTKLMESISMLDDFYMRYSMMMMENGSLSPVDKQNYRSLLRNLYLKMKYLLNVIKLCNKAHELRDPLNEIGMMEQVFTRVTSLQSKLDSYVLDLDVMTSRFNSVE